MDDELSSTHARQMLFLTAAWIANVDGEEHEAEIDALCQLRSALGLAPDLARKLHRIARGHSEFKGPVCAVRHAT